MLYEFIIEGEDVLVKSILRESLGSLKELLCSSIFSSLEHECIVYVQGASWASSWEGNPCLLGPQQ